jgi:polyferredoxin
MKEKINFKKMFLDNIWVYLVIYFAVTLMYPIFGIVALLCMLAPVIYSAFHGRKWCGWFCPRGNFNDNVLEKISFKRKYPEVIKKTWFRVLFFVILMTSFTVQLFFAKNLSMVGLIFFRMVFITTIIGIVLGIIYKHRAWCMFCPMGSLSTWVASVPKFAEKIKHVEFEKIKCVSCNICEKACPMEIKITSHPEMVTNPNCIKCSECVTGCRKDVLKF